MSAVRTVDAGSTAVVVDGMPLTRLGMAASLRLAGVDTVAHAADLGEGVVAAQQQRATLLVLGTVLDDTAEALGRHHARLGPTRLVVLLAKADRGTVIGFLEAGVDAVALRTIAPEDFGNLVRRVLIGERSVDPALVSVLLDAGRLGGQAPIGAGGSDTARTIPSAVAPDAIGEPVGLTTKELQVLARLANGDSNAEIADALFVSLATVKTHLLHIYAKLGVGSRHGAMSRAVALGLLH